MKGRPHIQLTPKTLRKIAEALFLAYTEEQAAYLGGISNSTLKRIRQTEIWTDILRQSLSMEKPYRQKIVRGLPGWQGAAWLLERKYPGQLSRPEIQLQLNSTNTTTNNVLTITAEQAADFKSRNAIVDEALSKLSPPASRQQLLAAALEESSKPPVDDASSFNTQKDTVRNESEGATGTRTPVPRRPEPEPKLTPNSKSLTSSSNSNSKTDSPAVIEGEVKIPKKTRKRLPPKIVLRPRVVRAMAGLKDKKVSNAPEMTPTKSSASVEKSSENTPKSHKRKWRS